MKKIEINDFLHFRFPSAPSFSPDGKLAAFVVQKASVEENRYVGDIYLLDVATGESRLLIPNKKTYLWSKRGTLLYPGEGKSWLEMDVTTGKSAPFFTLPVAAGKLFQVDADRFIVSASYVEKEKSPYTEADCDVLTETPFWANGTSGFTCGKRTRLYVYCRSADTLTPITEPYFTAPGFDVRGSKVLYRGSFWKDSRRGDQHAALWLYDLDTGDTKEIPTPGYFCIYSFSFWEEDSALVAAFDDSANNNMGFPDFYKVDIATGEMTLLAKLDAYVGDNRISSDSRLGSGRGTKLVGDRLYFLTTDGDNGYLKYFDKNGTVSEPLTPHGAADSFDISGENTLVCGMYGQKLSELYLNGKQVTNLNTAWYEEHTVVTPEFHSFLNDGYDIHGWAMKPAGYEPNKKHPAILFIHGGPRTAFSDIYHHEMQVWANAGYFVLFCNPRGSDGRGYDFGFIQGRYGIVDYSDVMAFTDEMLQKYPEIDPNRVGVAGGSYGGFVTNWIIGHTDRFAAAVSQRGIANWVTFEHTSDIGYYFTYGQQGATTVENPEKLWEKSPLRYAPNCTIPTLFIHADEDYRCPIADSYAMFTALKKAGCETKMVVFHGENHGLSSTGKPRNRIRRMEEILGWFDGHLKEKP